MRETVDPLSVLDRPEILQIVFYPRKAVGVPEADEKNILFHVEEGIRIGCRFYEAGRDNPVILYFHGNGEIATDYDDIGPVYVQMGINLLVADYRGYGFSSGTPTVAAILQDAHALFRHVNEWLGTHGYTGPLFVMGRSLGSLCAVEVARDHETALVGLVVESGSATNFRNLLDTWGFVAHDHPMWEEGRGFFNKEKIRQVTLPTLIIHGERDALIPASEGELLYENSGAERKTLVIIPGGDHNDLMLVGMRRYFDSLLEFVNASMAGVTPHP
jgi:hypothetical protein